MDLLLDNVLSDKGLSFDEKELQLFLQKDEEYLNDATEFIQETPEDLLKELLPIIVSNPSMLPIYKYLVAEVGVSGHDIGPDGKYKYLDRFKYGYFVTSTTYYHILNYIKMDIDPTVLIECKESHNKSRHKVLIPVMLEIARLYDMRNLCSELALFRVMADALIEGSEKLKRVYSLMFIIKNSPWVKNPNEINTKIVAASLYNSIKVPGDQKYTKSLINKMNSVISYVDTCMQNLDDGKMTNRFIEIKEQVELLIENAKTKKTSTLVSDGVASDIIELLINTKNNKYTLYYAFGYTQETVYKAIDMCKKKDPILHAMCLYVRSGTRTEQFNAAVEYAINVIENLSPETNVYQYFKISKYNPEVLNNFALRCNMKMYKRKHLARLASEYNIKCVDKINIDREVNNSFIIRGKEVSKNIKLKVFKYMKKNDIPFYKYLFYEGIREVVNTGKIS